MGSKYPSLIGREIEKRLRDLGCESVRQTGSHRHYSNPYQPHLLISFASHPGDVSRGVIEDIARDLGLTKDQFYDFNYKP